MSSWFCLSDAVLLETDALLAVEKPAGLLSVPDRWDKAQENLMGLLQTERPDQYLANVHRLDRDTTGVFLVAKTRDALRDLVRQFRERQTRQLYVALVAGAFSHGDRELVIDLPIGAHSRLPGHSRIDHKHGQPARSTVRTLEHFSGYTLLEVETESVRLHQVRVHLQAIGHPLMGDVAYGGSPLRNPDRHDCDVSRLRPVKPAIPAEVRRLF